MIIAVIPAKGSSTRLPNKNMLPINGKPMIYYSIKAAKDCKMIDRIYVSTDSDEIDAYAATQGVNVIRRGDELGGETPIVDVYIHSIKYLNDADITVVVGIQPDHPDRKIKLDEAITFCMNKNYDEVITVDKEGAVNGSLKIMKSDALLHGRIGAVGTIIDNCTNIHHLEDLKKAEKNIMLEPIK